MSDKEQINDQQELASGSGQQPSSGVPPLPNAVAAAVGSAIKEALGSLKGYFDHKISSVEEENKEKLQTAAYEVELLKRASSAASLKFKGNQKQLEHNSTVIANLERIAVDLKEGKVIKAGEGVEKVIEEVKKRNKLVQFADKAG